MCPCPRCKRDNASRTFGALHRAAHAPVTTPLGQVSRWALAPHRQGAQPSESDARRLVSLRQMMPRSVGHSSSIEQSSFRVPLGPVLLGRSGPAETGRRDAWLGAGRCGLLIGSALRRPVTARSAYAATVWQLPVMVASGPGPQVASTAGLPARRGGRPGGHPLRVRLPAAACPTSGSDAGLAGPGPGPQAEAPAHRALATCGPARRPSR